AALSGAAPIGGAMVTLTSSKPALPVQGSVTVAAGATTATFPATAGTISAADSAIITGSYNNTSRSEERTVGKEAKSTLTSLTCAPTSLNSNQTTTCTAALSGAAPTGGAVVTLTSSKPALPVQGSVTVAAGATTATFPATAGTISAADSAIITGSYNNTSQTATITLVPPALPTLTSL